VEGGIVSGISMYRMAVSMSKSWEVAVQLIAPNPELRELRRYGFRLSRGG